MLEIFALSLSGHFLLTKLFSFIGKSERAVNGCVRTYLLVEDNKREQAKLRLDF